MSKNKNGFDDDEIDIPITVQNIRDNNTKSSSTKERIGSFFTGLMTKISNIFGKIKDIFVNNPSKADSVVTTQASRVEVKTTGKSTSDLSDIQKKRAQNLGGRAGLAASSNNPFTLNKARKTQGSNVNPSK